MVQEELKTNRLSGYLVPRSDVHQGEYVAACDERLSWLTGFTGSAGICVVGKDRAGIFVDGRYSIQARKQTKSTFEIIFIPFAGKGWMEKLYVKKRSKRKSSLNQTSSGRDNSYNT